MKVKSSENKSDVVNITFTSLHLYKLKKKFFSFDSRQGGLRSTGCLTQFELFSMAVHTDLRAFGVFFSTLLLRRNIDEIDKDILLTAEFKV